MSKAPKLPGECLGPKAQWPREFAATFTKPAFAGSTFTPALDEESLDLAADLDEKFEVMEASLDEKEG